ncbi:MAG TPA: chorismate mutase [Lachnospiraceae bacterium]|nr:chorismate mutase [Lachnospiraceae bacterium]
MQCNSLEEVRENIDQIDRQIIHLLAQRGGLVNQASRFKKGYERSESAKSCRSNY